MSNLKARLKEYYDDPIYKPCFTARTKEEAEAARDTACSIRGYSAYRIFIDVLMQYHLSKCNRPMTGLDT